MSLGERFLVRSFWGGAITAVDARSSRSFARHSHDEFGIGMITAGAQSSWSGRGTVEAVRGNVITVNPAETHDGTAIGSGRTWSMLYLSPSIVAGAASDISEGRCASRELHAPVIADRNTARLFSDLHAVVLRSGESCAVDEQLLSLFGTLFGAAVPTSVPTDRLARVRDRIDNDPAGTHPLVELAAVAGLSRFQTLRGFARLTGLTPHAYLIECRLALSRRLIRQGIALTDSALTCGFADQSHMHRAFVARYGYTPGVYAAAFRRSAISFKNSLGPSR